MTGKRYLIEDVDTRTGQITNTYVVDSNTSSPRLLKAGYSARCDTSNASLYILQLYGALTTYLRTLFLPIGYPQSVTADYTPYQIYDSLQAFASSIAGLLASRAVLQSLDIGETGATAATVLAVVQNTLSNVTSILFASHVAARISADVKFYRFLADVVNDTAFVLDLLAPTLPRTSLPADVFGRIADFAPSPRVVVLCASSMLRAVCGVAGGSSKAVLSSHFAKGNPESVGDLNAKDGSQETVIGLLGMWAGGIVVSRVDGFTATWTWMIALLFIHLYTNWCAVKSVRLNHLNRERAGMVLEKLVAEGYRAEDVSVEAIGQKESVLGLRAMWHNIWLRVTRRGNQSWRTWKIGAPAAELIKTLSLTMGKESTLQVMLTASQGLPYLLSVSDTGQPLIALKADAKPIDQLQAMHHALILHDEVEAKKHMTEKESKSTGVNKDTIGALWSATVATLELGGWDLASTNLTGGVAAGIHIREISM